MPVGRARKTKPALDPARTGLGLGLAALLIVLGCESLQTAVADGDTRTISLHNVHTKEDLTITYKRNGRYDDAALNKINWILRDWRREEVIRIDPQLIDLVWEVHREVGSNEKIWVICGYRAPETNAMLRARSSGVAENSHHTGGRALDFYIPGAPLSKLREIGLRMQRGGVGFYPRSGSPFVHMDVGGVRHWPRMTHDQLARIFPDGRTVHVPSDGRPLAGYALARADLERRGSRASGTTMLASAQSPRNFLDLLFKRSETEDDRPAALPAPKRASEARTAVAAVTAPALKLPPPRPAAIQLASATAAVPMPLTRPAPRKPAASVAVAALSANDVINTRGYWVGLPQFEDTQVSAAARLRNDRSPAELALAYAASETTGTAYRAPRGDPRPRLTPETILASHAGFATPTVAASDSKPFKVISTLDRYDNPWMRAMMVAPDSRRFMSTTTVGAPDHRKLAPLIRKPDASVMMTFNGDPHLGMIAERFAGDAVVFVATVTFVSRQTAALR